MDNNPKYEKNYLLAFFLSMLVLVLYPVVLRYFYPNAGRPAEKPKQTQEAVLPGPIRPALTEPEGPFIEEPVPAALVNLKNSQYEIVFTTLGGAIKRLEYRGDTVHKNGFTQLLYEAENPQPGLLAIQLLHEKIDLSRAIFKLSRKEAGFLEFVYEKSGDYRLIKRFTLQDAEPIVLLQVTIENLRKQERHFPFRILYGLNRETGGPNVANFQAVVMSDKLESSAAPKIAKKGFTLSKNISWAGLTKKYFALLVKPELKAIEQTSSADERALYGSLLLEPISLGPSSSRQQEFFVYAGPQRYERLKSYDLGFEKILSSGIFGFFKIALLKGLKLSHRFTGNFGWDIIVLTFLLKGLFAPLTHISYHSMEKMKALQPKLKSLQEKYKNNPEKLNREMMELYKKHRVNPMSGCLPMLLQIPVFIAFYQVLNETIELQGAPFVGWIRDLSEPDKLLLFPFSIPLVGNSLNLLPLLMIGSMYYQQKLTPQSGVNPEQEKVFAYMPVIFGFIFYKMPSGLVLYWFVNNVLSIIQQVFIKRLIALPHAGEEHS